ncbi:hypothetical protein F2Q69_00036009 [Brassica cretica]|uniref:Uncharacterized protein n=1 Tax=Brassica cretica TaxID=69181 RepID=A0A8S9SD21_BRACR|nr:hypothetical protein F2Q69_00036009 [Brassica cretica]
MATWASNFPVAIWLPGPVTSRSPYGDPGLERLGRYMAIWAGNVPVATRPCSVLVAIWRPGLRPCFSRPRSL